MTPQELMREAIRLSVENVKNGGGPFGAVITKDGEIIARGANRVVPNNDPTAHAEVTAIRNACEKLGTFDLKGYEIYSSCEPCPMCLSAIYWARLDRLVYANTADDADRIGFSDAFIYKELNLAVEKRSLPTTTMLRAEALKAFRDWEEKADKVEY